MGGSAGLTVTVRIDIWSDVICPWCYLGQARLRRALDEVPFGSDVTVRWRAYQLDPRASREPGDLRQAIERKYGPGAFDGMTRRLTALGAAEGLTYRFDLAQRVNTLDAHRLLAWAAADDDVAAQDRLATRLFEAYFGKGANVADPAVLVAAAGDVGLDAETAAEVVASGAFADEVAADLEAAVERQLTGVPAFVIEDRLLIPGAQEVETMVALLTRAHDRFVVTAPATGDACDVDDPHC